MVSNKISKVIGILYRLKYVFPESVLFTFYNSLIVSYINYGLLLWGVDCHKLETLQKKALRFMTNSSYVAHTAPLLIRHGLLSVTDMYKLKLLKFYYKLSGTPQYLADLIKKHSPVRKLRSSHNPNLLEEPKYTGEKFGSKSFCVAGPRFWNRLPAELREISSLDTFKKHLKTHLFQKHYYTEN